VSHHEVLKRSYYPKSNPIERKESDLICNNWWKYLHDIDNEKAFVFILTADWWSHFINVRIHFGCHRHEGLACLTVNAIAGDAKACLGFRTSNIDWIVSVGQSGGRWPCVFRWWSQLITWSHLHRNRFLSDPELIVNSYNAGTVNITIIMKNNRELEIQFSNSNEINIHDIRLIVIIPYENNIQFSH
jgi:hypothetical protein